MHSTIQWLALPPGMCWELFSLKTPFARGPDATAPRRKLRLSIPPQSLPFDDTINLFDTTIAPSSSLAGYRGREGGSGQHNEGFDRERFISQGGGQRLPRAPEPFFLSLSLSHSSASSSFGCGYSRSSIVVRTARALSKI